MLELVKFIFSGFWTWLGFIILAYAVFNGILEIIKACKRNRRVTVDHTGEQWHITAENASRKDIITAMYAPGKLTNEEGTDRK